ncbi:MAG: TonB-dependent receptor, partial [Tannerella sp.]|nr:TonB-dependent receptor [Tannerella sp.]
QGSAGVYTEYGEALASPLAFDGGAMAYFMNRWHPSDPNADFFNPSTQWVSGYYPVTGHSTGEGTAIIQNASYVRLKTLEIGYTLPHQWLSRLGVQSLRLYVSGYNLLTFTGLKNMDPEHPGLEGNTVDAVKNPDGDYVSMYSYPNNKTYNVGAIIKF